MSQNNEKGTIAPKSMPQTSIHPSLRLTADNGLGEVHEQSPMLESYLSEESAVTARLLMAEKRDVNKERLEAARKQISMFEQRMSKKS